MLEIITARKSIFAYLPDRIRQMDFYYFPAVLKSFAADDRYIIRNNYNRCLAAVSVQNVLFYIELFISEGFSGFCGNQLNVVQHNSLVNDKRLAATAADCCTLIRVYS